MAWIADYEIIRPLGRGATGQFYVARPSARLGLTTNEVAVKVVSGVVGADPFKRVVKELRIFASVRSDCLVELFDAGQEQSSIYYAMSYYHDGSLADPAQPLDEKRILRAVADAARGAHDLHEAGVAHCNIKPANVLLIDSNGRLSDLGLAKFIAPGMTVTKTGLVGDVEYLEPGVIRGDRASRASDIWALGATLHRALTGRPMYPGLSTGDVLASLRRVMNERPTLDPGLPMEQTTMIASCLASDPGERPRTALALAAELDRLAEQP
jgi:serine/threonine protein kinase